MAQIKENKMKRYTIGLITGILLTTSAFMFMGAAQLSSRTFPSHGNRYSFKQTGSDRSDKNDMNYTVYDHEKGRIITIIDDEEGIVLYTNIETAKITAAKFEINK